MLDLLFKEMAQPTPFGPFHLTFFFITIVLIVLLLHFCRNCSDNTFRYILFISWAIILLFEIGKQIINNYNPTLHIWNAYNYSAFPYQFCSLPYYTLPLLIFLPESKFRDLLLVFSATFVFFGGFGYFFFPVSFCEYTFINIQTMVHHGLQVITGIFIFVHENEKMSYKKVLESTGLLVCAILISMVLNVVFYNVASVPETVNMFELSPINKTTAPVFSNILNATNYPVFLLIYIVGFLGFSTISYFAMKYIKKLIDILIEKHSSNKELVNE